MYNLIQGDCVKELSKLDSLSIDIVVSDIPYGINYTEWDVFHNNTNSAFLKSNKSMNNTTFKTRGKPINGWNEKDRQQSVEYQKWLEAWMIELFRVTKEASPIVLFSSRRNQHRVGCALENCGFLIRDVLIWEKNICNPKAQRINKVLEKRGIYNSKYNNYRIGNLAPFYEPILWAMKPYSKTITDCVINDGIGGFCGEDGKIPSNVLKFNCNIKNEFHPSQKPLDLIEYLVRLFSAFDGQTILDPFMGSGTTGVACINTGRNFIGIELDQKYYNIAKNRLQEVEK